jgi:hypothetical protein
MKYLFPLLFLLASLPAHPDDNAVTSTVGAVAGFLAEAMDTTGGDDE